jgi:carboxylesterase type B
LMGSSNDRENNWVVTNNTVLVTINYRVGWLGTPPPSTHTHTHTHTRTHTKPHTHTRMYARERVAHHSTRISHTPHTFRTSHPGFAALDELRRRSPENSTGNIGMLDQRAAFQWALCSFLKHMICSSPRAIEVHFKTWLG